MGSADRGRVIVSEVKEKKRIEITYERLHELLNYDRETGIFNWRITRGGGARAGLVAGSLNLNGFIFIKIDGKTYSAHQLAWLYIKGYFPKHGINHKDQIRHHNWFSNLREVNQVYNLRTAKPIVADNTSGIKGVGWHKLKKKWQAYIMINQKMVGLGCFEHKIEAAIARHNAEINYQWGIRNSKELSAYSYIQNHKEELWLK